MPEGLLVQLGKNTRSGCTDVAAKQGNAMCWNSYHIVVLVQVQLLDEKLLRKMLNQFEKKVGGPGAQQGATWTEVIAQLGIVQEYAASAALCCTCGKHYIVAAHPIECPACF